jgi:hypothetical protein
MKRAVVVLIALTAVLAASCGASGDSKGSDGETTTTAADGGSSGASDAAFGDLTGPLCGKGDFSIDPAEAGKGTDKLYIGVPNDRSAEIRPGLNKVMYDASVAFAGWCNDQGGIGGLPIEIVDMDAALFNVEAVMTTACNEAFAMVGGGLAQDALEFSGKDGSDFHKCGMIDIPGFAVSAEKADSNGQVEPIPNPGNSVANTWFRDFNTLYPDNDQWTVVWGDLPSLELTKTKYQAAVADVGGLTDLGDQSYPVVGITDWTPYVQKMIGTGASTFSWVGEVENLTGFLKSARQQGWDGIPLLETNMYDQKLLAAGADTEGSIVRMQLHPLEEADEWPAIQQYIDINKEFVDGGETGALGIQSTSAWLLFATAANACGEKNDGVLDRTCILQEAAAVKDWTGGGLHAPQDPGPANEAVASPCSLLLVVKDGKFVRKFPDIGGEDDTTAGFHCPADGVTILPGATAGVIDPDRPI